MRQRCFYWQLLGLFFVMILASFSAFHAQADSSMHEIRWVRGSSSTISEDLMTVVPNKNMVSEHVLQVSFSFSNNVDVGGAEIRLPATIFTGWDGNPVGTAEPAILHKDNVVPGAPIGYPFVWYIDETTQELVITNHIPLEAGYSVSVEVPYKVWSNQVLQEDQGNGTKLLLIDNIQAKFFLNETETYESNTLRMSYDTKADLNSGYKEGVPYRKWDTSGWGAPSEDMDTSEYVYVRWKIWSYSSTDDSQPFALR